MTSIEASHIADAKSEQAHACSDPRIKEKLMRDADFYAKYSRELHAQELQKKLAPTGPAATPEADM